MAKVYKINTFQDILKALRERPEWLEELRKLILTNELLALPQRFESFVKEEFLPLKEKVDKIEEDVEILKEDVRVIKEDVSILKEDVRVLKEDVRVLKEDVRVLKEEVKVLKDDVAELKGDNFERKVRERAPAYFGKLIRNCKLISPEELANFLDDALDMGVISEEERLSALNADVVVTGVLRADKEKRVVIVGEISVKADRTDIERAVKRAKIIEKALKLPAFAIVIGKEYTKGAKEKAKELEVILL